MAGRRVAYSSNWERIERQYDPRLDRQPDADTQQLGKN
jgi:hypothetical protein